MKSGATAVAACAPIAPSLTCAQRKPGRVGRPPASARARVARIAAFPAVRRIARTSQMTEPRNRVVRLSHFGDPERLEVVDAPLPVPAPGEVRVRVLASGLEYTDVVIRRHLYPVSYWSIAAKACRSRPRSGSATRHYGGCSVQHRPFWPQSC